MDDDDSGVEINRGTKKKERKKRNCCMTTKPHEDVICGGCKFRVIVRIRLFVILEPSHCPREK